MITQNAVQVLAGLPQWHIMSGVEFNSWPRQNESKIQSVTAVHPSIHYLPTKWLDCLLSRWFVAPVHVLTNCLICSLVLCYLLTLALSPSRTSDCQTSDCLNKDGCHKGLPEAEYIVLSRSNWSEAKSVCMTGCQRQM